MDRAERVLVVPRDVLLGFPEPALDGFRPGPADDVLRLIDSAGFFAARCEVETDPEVKQIIPYAFVTSGPDVFLCERRPKGGEARLHGRVSLGLGGHVQEGDLKSGGTAQAVRHALERELREEVLMESSYRVLVAGVLNDDAEPVGQVHFGIVYRVDIEEPRVRVLEDESLAGSFVPACELWSYQERMESWSRILQGHFWPQPRPWQGVTKPPRS